MKKERLYIHEIIEEPVVSYPAWYTLSPKLSRDERLHETLRALHMMDFCRYRSPENPSQIFDMLRSGAYPVYMERYAVGLFGGRLMYLESPGWKTMPVCEDVFDMENWLISDSFV
jgi:hypothetical protein